MERKLREDRGLCTVFITEGKITELSLAETEGMFFLKKKKKNINIQFEKKAELVKIYNRSTKTNDGMASCPSFGHYLYHQVKSNFHSNFRFRVM